MDLQAENAKLLTEGQIWVAKYYFACYPDANRLPKKVSRFKFTVIKLEDTLYAIYSGKKGKALKDISTSFADSPGRRKVKWMQNLNTAELAIIKIITLKLCKQKADYFDRDNTQLDLEYAKREQEILAFLKKSLGSFERYREANEGKREKKQYIIGIKLEPGVPLNYFIDNYLKEFNLVQRLDIAISILKAILYVHEKDIIHRDIKPSNIMLSADKTHFIATLIDYGCALLALDAKKESLAYVGTDGYKAPELFAFLCFGSAVYIDPFDAYTKRGDIYSTGVTLFQLFNMNGIDNLLIKQLCIKIKKYIKKCLCNFDFDRRPSLEMAINDFEFFKRKSLEISELNPIEKNTVTVSENELKLIPQQHAAVLITRFHNAYCGRMGNLINTIDIKNLYIRWCNSIMRPKQVSKEDIQKNGKLLTDEEIAKAKDHFNKNPSSGRFSKRQSGFKFTVVRFNAVLYAIYSGKNGKALQGVKPSRDPNEGNKKKVKLMQDLDTEQWVVIKTIILPSKENPKYTECLERAKNEIKILMLLRKCLGYVERFREAMGKKTEQEQYMIGMELEPGVSLDHFIKYHLEEFNLVQCFEISIDILKAIQKLHEKGIIHRDIKPNNIMIAVIEGRISVEIIDYEVALDSKERAELKICSANLVGTPHYIAPEIYDFHCHAYVYTERSDIYATGVTLDQLFREKMFNNPTMMRDYEEIEKYISERMCHRMVGKRSSLQDLIKYFELLKNQYAEPTAMKKAVMHEKAVMNGPAVFPPLTQSSLIFFCSLPDLSKYSGDTICKNRTNSF